MENRGMTVNHSTARAGWKSFRPVVFCLLLSSCAAIPSVRGYYTPEEVYQNAAGLGGKTIAVRGTITIESTFCTEVYCPPDSPCCNSCYYHAVFPVDANNSIWLTGADAGCSGNSCRADCPLLEDGRMYEITGSVDPNSGPIVYFEMRQWKPVK